MTTVARHSLRLLLCLAVGLALQLHAATAKDIQGEWVVDGTATWDATKSAPPEQQKMMETMIVGQMSGSTMVISADTITHSMPNGMTSSIPYKMTKIEGDTIVTESIRKAHSVSGEGRHPHPDQPADARHDHRE